MRHSYITNVFPYTFDTPYQESSSSCRASIITSKWTYVPESSTFRPKRFVTSGFSKKQSQFEFHNIRVDFLILIIITCVRCQVLTKDSVTVSVDAVVYFRVSNATMSVTNVENAHYSTRLLSQTTLRNILGTKDLHQILSDRETISGSMQAIYAFPFAGP